MGLNNKTFTTSAPATAGPAPTPAFFKLVTYLMRHFTYDNAPEGTQYVAYQLQGRFEGFWGKATENWGFRHCIKVACNPKYGWHTPLYYYSEEGQTLEELAAGVLADMIARIGEPFGVDFQARVKPAVTITDVKQELGLPEAAPAIAYATPSQKEEIIRLLNHPVITRQEKTKMLLNINRLDEEKAVQAIAKLKKAIYDREHGGE